MKILIGLCTGSAIHAQTVTSLVKAVNKLKDEGHEYRLAIQVGGYKSPAMNRLVREAQEGGFDFLMSIDNDMIFPDDGITKLIDHDKDIVGAAYNVRGNSITGNPLESTIKIADKNGKRIATTQIPKHLFKAWALGLGFTLFKTSVFDKVEAPWFEESESVEGEFGTEDVVFCEKAQKAGIEVWCNPSIEMGHIGTAVY
jgi:GT2 family glycosyltransferase